MSTKTKATTILGLLLALCYLVLLVVVHVQLRDQALQNAESQIRKFLYSYRSVRQLVQKNHKPEIFRLQKSGQLDADYFSPVLLSSTHIARSFLDYLNATLEKEGEPTVTFKLAADNPRNPLNLADASERKLLNAIRRGEIREYHDVIQDRGGPVLLFALPTEPMEKSCLRCHGDPDKAPRMLREQYDDNQGFHEKEGNIRALLSMRIPLQTYYDSESRLFAVIALVALLVFGLFFAVVAVFLGRIEDKNRRISEQNRELERIAHHDPLTGALNRYGLQLQFDRLLAVAERYRQPLSILMLDIDRFKRINDSYGHAHGDQVLVEVSNRILKQLRNADAFCRWGGEEFLVCLPNTSLENATSLAERMRRTLAGEPLVQDDRTIPVTASFGVTALQPGDRMDDVIGRADSALYRAKELGRNRVCSHGTGI